MITLYDNVRTQYMLYAPQLMDALDGEVDMEHEQLIEYIEQQNMKQAVETIRTHIINMKHRLMESFVKRSE